MAIHTILVYTKYIWWLLLCYLLNTTTPSMQGALTFHSLNQYLERGLRREKRDILFSYRVANSFKHLPTSEQSTSKDKT
ncbi:hypothetical protein F5Y12DRAFT_464726 [Xylaria sp. FL1777]|nr:hypothetical protein F5Y12DRAFT_464726 [Xylaria sp. FL1777]